MRLALAPLALLFAAGNGQQEGTATCIDLSGEIEIEFEGTLRADSITLERGTADGSLEEFEHRFFLLTLPKQQCFTDGDVGEREFTTVHVYSGHGEVAELIELAEGSQVRVSGEAFGGHTRYHMAPVVLDVSALVAIDPPAADDQHGH